MPFAPRETIYTAVFNLVKGIVDFKTTGRIVKHWDKLKQGEFPAMFMGERKETASNVHKGVQKWTLVVDFFLYIDVGNTPNITPATVMNGLLDDLDSVLKPNASGQWQTLGGLVYAVRIADITKDNASLGTKSVAIVSVEIITNS